MFARLARVTLAVALIVSTACQDSTGIGWGASAAQARWNERRPASYRYTVSRSCECMAETTAPVIVTITNGAVASRRYVSTGADVAPAYAALYPTIDELFAIIDEARRDHVASLDVTYDPTWGFPTHVSIDRNASMVDDEILYVVSAFTLPSI